MYACLCVLCAGTPEKLCRRSQLSPTPQQQQRTLLPLLSSSSPPPPRRHGDCPVRLRRAAHTHPFSSSSYADLEGSTLRDGSTASPKPLFCVRARSEPGGSGGRGSRSCGRSSRTGQRRASMKRKVYINGGQPNTPQMARKEKAEGTCAARRAAATARSRGAPPGMPRRTGWGCPGPSAMDLPMVCAL